VVNTPDMKAIEIMANGFINTMFPHTEQALNTLRTNSLEFLSLLNNKFETLSKDEMGKFSEVDVQIALRTAINSAARKNSPALHNTLAKLIIDRVQKPTRPIAELAIDESIEIVSKLDTNLIKMISLSFMLSRMKYINISDKNILYQKLASIVNHFSDLKVSTSKFEYLDAISCGKLLQITSNNLLNIISNNYQQLFITEIPVEKVSELDLEDNIKSAAFYKNDSNHFQLNPIFGLHLFDGVTISQKSNNIPFSISKEDKSKITSLCKQHKLTPQQVESLLCENINGFSHIIELWNTGGFSSFSLTALGIAIGRAYLEQNGFGDYDINIWIN